MLSTAVDVVPGQLRHELFYCIEVIDDPIRARWLQQAVITSLHHFYKIIHKLRFRAGQVTTASLQSIVCSL